MYKHIVFIIVGFWCISASSCLKVPIELTDNVTENDPNIVFIDNQPITVENYKLDSFVTSGKTVLAVGNHSDAEFGKIHSTAFLQFDIPISNPVANENVVFDSIVLQLKTNGEYYGDTTLPITINVHQLIDKIENEDASTTFYNLRSFAYSSSILASATFTIQPKRQRELHIRLPDTLGNMFLQKLRTSDTDLSDNLQFVNLFKGIVLHTDSTTTNNLFFLTGFDGTNAIRLYYKVRGTIATEKTIDFPINGAHHYNRTIFNFNNTALQAFNPFKTQLLNSSRTGNKAYVHSMLPIYAKFNFPGLQSLKELYPFVRIMKAELEVPPFEKTYNYPYTLPPALSMYITDENNNLLEPLKDITGQASQNGNLIIDKLYGEKTKYSYDVTGFINQLFAEGRFSKTGLMLVPSVIDNPNIVQRAVFGNQQFAKGVKLKLYLLGL